MNWNVRVLFHVALPQGSHLEIACANCDEFSAALFRNFTLHGRVDALKRVDVYDHDKRVFRCSRIMYRFLSIDQQTDKRFKRPHLGMARRFGFVSASHNTISVRIRTVNRNFLGYTEETTRTLFCGDLFSHTGDGPALTASDIVAPAKVAEELFRQSALTPATGETIRKLADFSPRTLALMHGSSFNGDAVRALHDLAGLYDGWFEEGVERNSRRITA